MPYKILKWNSSVMFECIVMNIVLLQILWTLQRLYWLYFSYPQLVLFDSDCMFSQWTKVSVRKVVDWMFCFYICYIICILDKIPSIQLISHVIVTKILYRHHKPFHVCISWIFEYIRCRKLKFSKYAIPLTVFYFQYIFNYSYTMNLLPINVALKK